MPKKWIVGLGNPDKKYQQTRHNAGFMAVSLYAALQKLEWQSEKNESLWVRQDSGENKLYLLMPQTYMNDSGRSVLKWKSKEGLDPLQMLVVYDDMDLPFGRIRFRAEGSGGSHNGMASIIDCLGTDKFPRLRIGIAKPENPEEWADYVLKKFSPEEQAALPPLLARCVESIKAWVDETPYDRLMSKTNA